MSLSGHTCSVMTDQGVEESWEVPRLWEASAALPAELLDVHSLEEVHDADLWLSYYRHPTHPKMVPELDRIEAADLAYPVILHPDGWLMDGWHRVAKVLRSGGTKIRAVRFTVESLPPPDRTQAR